METKRPRIWLIVISVIVICFAFLAFISVSSNTETLLKDYDKLYNAKITIMDLFGKDIPNVTNPAGPFGVIVGFWLIYTFGKFFAMSLLGALGLLAFFSIFWGNDKNFILKLFSFILFAFFLNILLMAIKPQFQVYSGVIPWSLFGFLENWFNSTGTIIISLIVTITSLFVIFETKNILLFFKSLFMGIYKFIIVIFSIFKISKKEKIVKPKKLKEKKIKESVKPGLKKKKKIEPNIIDHTDFDEKENNDSTEPRKVKKIVPKTISPDEIDDREYIKPDVEEFLTSAKLNRKNYDEARSEIKKTSRILIEKLAEFDVEAEVINVNIGPIITQYEIKPAPGVKVSKFNALADDLALAIKATSIRVQAPIPGRGLVGIEIPNKNRDTIMLKDILKSDAMQNMKSKLGICLGKDISGNSIVDDLGKMPHLLIAGATGSGKSVCVNTIIATLLFNTVPEEVRFILIDPKRIELSGYEGIPHLIQQVVTDNEDALTALNWGVMEMERRYDLLQHYKVRDLKAYNKLIESKIEAGDEIEEKPLPYIVIIVDELADLMMTVGREIERPITRLAQMARAIGIHLILATQRPSIKVITGIIKANFPSRIAFKVSSKIDSRVILDANGSEKLLGMGDMLFLPPGKGVPVRIHGAFISNDEIHSLVSYLKTQPKPEQEITIITDEETNFEDFEYDDELFPEAAVAVVSAGQASVSMLQRHFKVGYARAGRLIDMLERSGIVGPHVGSKPREVLASEEDMRNYGFLKH